MTEVLNRLATLEAEKLTNDEKLASITESTFGQVGK